MRLPILTYHLIDNVPSPVSLTPIAFERQMERLRRAGYRLLPLGEALVAAQRDERVAAVTFDDGYAAVYDIALPLLERSGGRATVFAISDYVGRDNQWPGQSSVIPPRPLATWDQLHELARAGWEIGAHTRTHPDLRLLAEDALQEEVVGGKSVLEGRLGCSVDHFAYPYGLYDDRARKVVRRHYRAACSTTMGWATECSDLDALERIETWYFGRPGTHCLLGSRLMRPFVAVCRAARSRRLRRTKN